MEGISPRRHRDGARHEEASIAGSSERKPRSETKPSKTARPAEPIPRPDHPRFPASTRRTDARPGVVTEAPAGASRSAVSAPAKEIQDPVEIRPRRDERTTLSEGASRYTMQCISQQDSETFDESEECDENPSLPCSCPLPETVVDPVPARPVASLTFPAVHAILDDMLKDINQLDLKYSTASASLASGAR
jgi:hypothetical protein